MIKLIKDTRLGSIPTYHLSNDERFLMQVPDEVRKCAFFVCSYEEGCGINQYKCGGTGFFVKYKVDSYEFIYLVTAKHVITQASKNDKQEVILRINKKDGSFAYITTKSFDWKNHPTDPFADVAVLGAPIDSRIFDFVTIPSGLIVTKDIIYKEGIGCGDEVFLTGLFVNHYGKRKNIPIIRIGNIASMPEEPVILKLGKSKIGIDAYLIEARSIGGLSGSPVFINVGGYRIRGSSIEPRTNIFYLLGLIWGHWDLDLEPKDKPDEEDSTTKKDTLSEDSFNQESVNMGIAIVTPAEKILETIEQEYYIKKREEIICHIEEKRLPVLDNV